MSLIIKGLENSNITTFAVKEGVPLAIVYGSGYFAGKIIRLVSLTDPSACAIFNLVSFIAGKITLLFFAKIDRSIADKIFLSSISALGIGFAVTNLLKKITFAQSLATVTLSLVTGVPAFLLISAFAMPVLAAGGHVYLTSGE